MCLQYEPIELEDPIIINEAQPLLKEDKYTSCYLCLLCISIPFFLIGIVCNFQSENYYVKVVPLGLLMLALGVICINSIGIYCKFDPNRFASKLCITLYFLTMTGFSINGFYLLLSHK